MYRRTLKYLAVAALGLAVALGAGSAADAGKGKVKKAKIREGTYAGKKGKQNMYMGVRNGRIWQIQSNLLFGSGSGSCTPTAYSDGRLSEFWVTPKKPVKPKQNGTFSFKGQKQADNPQFKTTVNGRRLANGKFNVTVAGVRRDCSAKVAFKNVKWFQR